MKVPTAHVHIMSNKRNGVLYVGVTNDLIRRCYEHRHGLVAGFTKRYGLKQLVYFETYDDIRIAIQREKYQALVTRMEGAVDQWCKSRMERLG